LLEELMSLFWHCWLWNLSINFIGWWSVSERFELVISCIVVILEGIQLTELSPLPSVPSSVFDENNLWKLLSSSSSFTTGWNEDDGNSLWSLDLPSDMLYLSTWSDHHQSIQSYSSRPYIHLLIDQRILQLYIYIYISWMLINTNPHGT